MNDGLSSRVINLVAEDNAIEDTLYHLHRALGAGRIDLERFLRVSQTFPLIFLRVLSFIITGYILDHHFCLLVHLVRNGGKRRTRGLTLHHHLRR